MHMYMSSSSFYSVRLPFPCSLTHQSHDSELFLASSLSTLVAILSYFYFHSITSFNSLIHPHQCQISTLLITSPTTSTSTSTSHSTHTHTHPVQPFHIHICEAQSTTAQCGTFTFFVRFAFSQCSQAYQGISIPSVPTHSTFKPSLW